MSKQLKVGILYTKVGQLDETIHRCLQWGYPQIVLPGQKANVDVLIIPDGIGAYAGMLCFAGNTASAAFRALDRPMCQLVEVFRITLRGLSYYQEERGIPIIGIGEGRIMLWDKLNHKVGIGGRTYYLLAPEKTESFTSTHVERGMQITFSTETGLHGVEDLQSQTLDKIMRQIAKDAYSNILLTQDKEWANPSKDDNDGIE